MEKWKKYKILIVGCGHIGKRHARILVSLGIKQIIVFDTNQEQIESLKKDLPNIRVANSFVEGLLGADIVFILTPTKHHIPMAIQAVKVGCHVFIEKPLSTDMKGVNELERLALDMEKKVMVGLCLRYHEGIMKVKQLLDSGRIGRLVSVRALVGEHFPEVHPEYKSLYYAKYSGAFELMHDLDLAIWFTGQQVKKAYCVFGSYSDIGIEAPDTVEFLLGFEDRCTATVHLDFFQYPRRRNLELIGTKGVILIDFASWDQYVISVYDKDIRIWESESCLSNRDDMFRNEDLEFLDAILNDKPIMCNIQEGCKSLRVIEAVQLGVTDLSQD